MDESEALIVFKNYVSNALANILMIRSQLSLQLTFILYAEIVFEVMEAVQIELIEFFRVLDGDDVFPLKRLIRE